MIIFVCLLFVRLKKYEVAFGGPVKIVKDCNPEWILQDLCA